MTSVDSVQKTSLSLSLKDWLKETPTYSSRKTWEDWWSRGQTFSLAQKVPPLLEKLAPLKNFDITKSDPPELEWTVSRLLEDEGNEWLNMKMNAYYSTPLTHLARRFREWGFPALKPNSPAEEAMRKRLFHQVMTSLSEKQFSSFSAEQSEKNWEPSLDIGLMVTTAAYHLGDWSVVDALKTIGQEPDRIGKIGGNPLFFACPAAWDRVLAEGYDPLKIISSSELIRDHQKKRQWQHWIGSWAPKINEDIDPYRKRVLTWAKEHDPEGYHHWMNQSAIDRVGMANNADDVEAAWRYWTQRPEWETLATSHYGTPLWEIALEKNPLLWWPVLQESLTSHHLKEKIHGEPVLKKILKKATITEAFGPPSEEAEKRFILLLESAKRKNEKTPTQGWLMDGERNAWTDESYTPTEEDKKDTTQQQDALLKQIPGHWLWENPSFSENCLQRGTHLMLKAMDDPNILFHRARFLVRADTLHPVNHDHAFSCRLAVALAHTLHGRPERIRTLSREGLLSVASLDAWHDKYPSINTEIKRAMDVLRTFLIASETQKELEHRVPETLQNTRKKRI